MLASIEPTERVERAISKLNSAVGGKAAIAVMQINREDNKIVLIEEDYDVNIDQLRKKLPDDSPKYIAYKPSGAGINARPVLVQYLPLPASTFVLLLHFFYAFKVKNLMPVSKDCILESKTDLSETWLDSKLK